MEILRNTRVFEIFLIKSIYSTKHNHYHIIDGIERYSHYLCEIDRIIFFSDNINEKPFFSNRIKYVWIYSFI